MHVKLTQLLESLPDGGDRALGEVVAAVQKELRLIAAKCLAGERQDHTLQATALVNEAYMRLVDQRDRRWETKSQFLGIAAIAMRRVLLEHARARLADKRGGQGERVTLFEVPTVLDDEPAAIVALDGALAKFAEIDPENARIVELRWFGGLEVSEVAAILGVSTRSVERSWRVSAAWLRERISPK